jgi:heavy metal sensor kinase
MSRWTATSIRARLTGWYAVVLTVMMIAYASTTFVAVRHEFLEQLDERLHDDFAAAEGRLTRAADGRVVWSADPHPDVHDDETRVYEVWSATGEQIHRSGAPAALPPISLPAAGSSDRYETVLATRGRWRTLAAPVTIDGHTVALRVSRSEERVREELSEVLFVLILGLPLIVALAGVGGYVLARRALAPIDHLASEARRITAERLHERLKVPNDSDEIGRLTGVINETFARLESSFDQLRRFTADSSHELRTPLAVVRGIGEAAVAQRRTSAEYEEAIGSMLEEVDRMSNLVDTLLRLSNGDAGTIRLSRELLDLGELAADVAGSLSVLAEERHQTLTFEITSGVIVSVDRIVFREAVTNVLDNAIKYSPDGATIAIRVERIGDLGLLAIVDEGPGIPSEHRERIFHRFFRVDEARSRERGGTGLGLAIAKWAVEIHDGQIGVHERPRGGSEFQIQLPVAVETISHEQAPTGASGRVTMKAVFIGCAIASSLGTVSMASAQEIPAEYQHVLTTLGKQGDYKANVLKVNVPRNDLSVTVAKVRTPTPFGFGGWVAMTKGTGGMELLMGDLVLTQDEVNPVMSALLDNGLEVTALHNHFFWDEPRMFYMHVHGHGAAADLARKLKPALDLIGKSGAATTRGSTPPPAAAAKIDTATIAKIVGTEGEQTGEVYKITLGRDDLELTEMGAPINARMGLNTWAAFVGADANAAIAGDVAMLASEVTPVLKALRKNGLDVVAIHHHMTGTQPTIYFLHYWGTGPAEKLATGFKAALAELGKPNATASRQ